MDVRRTLRLLAVGLLAASVLTACTVSVTGGVAGGALSALLLLLLVVAGGSQTACDDDDGPAPDPEDAAARLDGGLDFGPCLGAPLDDMFPPDAQIGPCLSPLEPDSSVGPCLGAPLDDMGVIDAQVGPCLSPPEQDFGVGPCLDTLPEDAGPPDAEIGPCLSPPPPPGDAGFGAALPPRPGVLDKAAILARVLPGLPPDVAARLAPGDDRRES
ncbi:MAG: hypothetical protein H6706_30800 [Myxococcales bacterium]|nr:hypothetical protein [Myxococcales bacterium]